MGIYYRGNNGNTPAYNERGCCTTTQRYKKNLSTTSHFRQKSFNFVIFKCFSMQGRKGTIPFPESLILAPACENDLSVLKENWGEAISNRTCLGDKIYSLSTLIKKKQQRKRLKCLRRLKLSKESL
ncbi:MAG: hypothetical protein LBR55_02540 [Bacteroidales bacterium]|jgi:hypothetical protein|nr:hypothetical protein [Bacteroidales bacterium]